MSAAAPKGGDDSQRKLTRDGSFKPSAFTFDNTNCIIYVYYNEDENYTASHTVVLIEGFPNSVSTIMIT